MKLRHTLLAGAAVALLPGAAQAQGWDIGVEGLYMTRSTQNEVLVEAGPSDDFATLESQDFSHDWTPGIQANVDYWFTPQDGVSLSGFYLFEGTAEKGLLSPDEDIDTSYDDNPLSDVPTGNSSSAYASIFNWDSQVWGVALDYKRDFFKTGGFNVVGSVGFAYRHFSDDFLGVTFDEENDYLGTDDDIDVADIDVDNDLYGGRIGLGIHGPVMTDVTLSIDTAFGLYANRAQRDRTFDRIDFAGVDIDDSDDTTSFAQSFEASVGLSWEVFPGVAVNGGYQVMMLNDVGSGIEEYAGAADTTDSFEADSFVIYHGAFLGAHIRF